jgi:hypothetical protein
MVSLCGGKLNILEKNLLKKMNRNKMHHPIRLLLVFIISILLVGTVTATSKTINVNIVETRNISLLFSPINTINNFTVVVDRNTNFLNDLYPISDNGLNIIKSASRDLQEKHLLYTFW